MILDCCQLEPSPDSIKHEEGMGNDKSSGSPGGDASGEGNSHLSAGDMKLNSPKTDPEGHSHRGRGRSAAASHGLLIYRPAMQRAIATTVTMLVTMLKTLRIRAQTIRYVSIEISTFVC